MSECVCVCVCVCVSANSYQDLSWVGLYGGDKFFPLGCWFTRVDFSVSASGRGGWREIMHSRQMYVAPTPTSKRAHKLMIMCTVSIALANHHTLLDIGVDATFIETSLLVDPLGRRDRGRERAATAFNICSDITNTQVGISGETVPEGGNLHIY